MTGQTDGQEETDGHTTVTYYPAVPMRGFRIIFFYIAGLSAVTNASNFASKTCSRRPTFGADKSILNSQMHLPIGLPFSRYQLQCLPVYTAASPINC